jgi:hypothetical protein
MIGVVRVELLKLRTARVTLGMLAAVAGLTALGAALDAGHAGAPSSGVSSLSTAAGQSTVTTATGWALLLAAVMGVIISSGEFRHSTATSTYLMCPNRVRVLVAKAVAAAAVGALFGLVAAAVATVVGLEFTAGHGYHFDLPAASLLTHAGGAILGSALLATLGVALGSLVRSQLAGVIAVLLWALVVESILGGAFTSIRPYLPYTAATTLAGEPLGVGPGGFRVAVHHGASAAAGPLPFGLAVGLLLALALVLSVVAALTTVRADVT